MLPDRHDGVVAAARQAVVLAARRQRGEGRAQVGHGIAIEGPLGGELAPLAGFYPSVYVGVPWWFLDAPEAMRRFRSAVMETAGFSRTSGFVDDTRAFCSIPARHDTARRIDAGVLAQLVAEHQLGEDEALETAVDLVTKQPTTVFKL